MSTVEPRLRGHPAESQTPLERPFDIVNLNINVLISTADERPPLMKGHFSGAKEGFHSISFIFRFINCVLPHRDGLVVSMSISHAVGHLFVPWSGHTKDHLKMIQTMLGAHALG